MKKGKSRTQNTIMNTAAGFLTRISNMIARLMLQTVLIRVLGVQYTGVSGLFTSVLTILSFAELGIGSAITYELYKPLVERDEKRIAALMTFYKTAYRLVAAIVLICGMLIIPFLNFFVKEVPDISESIILIYMMFVVKTVFSYLLIYKSTLLVANQQNYIVSEIQAAACLIRTVIECVLLYFTKQYMTYLVVEILGTIAQNLWISRVAEKQHPTLKLYSDERIGREDTRRMLKSIKGLAMYKASFALGNGVDNIIISATINTASVGLVTNYTLIRKELEMLIKQFYNSVIPSVGNLAVTSTEDRQHEVFTNLFFLDFWISCFCTVSYFALIQPFIVLWFGEEYLLSLAVAGALAVDFYLACMLNPIASFRTANGIFVQGQYRPLIMVIINIALSLMMGLWWGIPGVFIATIVSRLVTQWYDPYLLFKLVFKRSPRRFFIMNYSFLLLTVALSMLVYLLGNMLPIHNIWINIIARAALCVVLPNAVILLLFHRTEEFKYCVGQIRTIGRRLLKKLKIIRG